MSTVKLITVDRYIFYVDFDVAKVSRKLKRIIDEKELTGDDTEVILVFDDITCSVMDLAIDWAKYHKNDPPIPDVDPSELLSTDIIPWDVELLKDKDTEQLFELMFAASKLDMPVLYELVSKTMANMIKGKTTKEIQKLFNIENDLTPEQLQEIDIAHSWCLNL